MRTRSIFYCACRVLGAAFALQILWPVAPHAAERQAGEDRWVPSFAITSGISIQHWDGTGDSTILKGGVPPAQPLRGLVDGNDLSVEPFVGGTLELMSPALPLPTRPRIFLSAGILPTFAAHRSLAIEGNPGCVTPPQPGAPCAKEITGAVNLGDSFPEDAAVGVGTRTAAELDTWLYTASLGIAFPFELYERQLRIKPSVGWVHYQIDGEGNLVNADCLPVSNTTRCLPELNAQGAVQPGFLRQPDALSAKGSRQFDGIGPGIELEMEAARWGPLGLSLYTGAHAFYIVGDHSFDFGTSQAYSDILGNDVVNAKFDVEVDDWMYRAQVGLRFSWLGGE